MTGLKTLVAAALIATIPAIPAALAFDEPSAFQAMNPDRDVLNGGQLTPAGRLGLERAGGAAGLPSANDAYATMPDAVPPVRAQHHRYHRSQ
jgi:hypothetical protein